MNAPPGRRKTHEAFEEAIEELALLGFSVSQIERELRATVEAIARRDGWDSWQVPSRRTIQRIFRRTKPSDSSGAWRIEDSPPDDARVLLDFLAELITSTEGRIAGITRREADWILRLRRLGPPVATAETLHLARHYATLRELGKSTADLDTFLAFAPWLSSENLEAYFAAIDSQWFSGAARRSLSSAALFQAPLELLCTRWQSLDESSQRWRRAANEIELRLKEQS